MIYVTCVTKNIKKIVVTGSAGFIGASLCEKLLERGDSVVGIDNHNEYYDPELKEARFKRLLKYLKQTFESLVKNLEKTLGRR